MIWIRRIMQISDRDQPEANSTLRNLHNSSDHPKLILLFFIQNNSYNFKDVLTSIHVYKLVLPSLFECSSANSDRY